MSARVVFCCGSGGVGKTTVSAALALKWAVEGARVAVITIDPARRLADSLSIGRFGNEPRPVPLDLLADDPRGTLEAMMLDAKATFDGLVRRLAPSAEVAERVLGNRYYRFTSERLGGTHEYMAMEKLLELRDSGRYDVVVVDTPPARHALDFLRAPDRISELLDQGVLRWLVMPATRGGWRALELGSEAVARVLRRVLGLDTVTEIARFFESFREMWDDFRARADRVRAMLREPTTRFVLVTTPTPAARADALAFLEVLDERALPFGGFVLNRVLEPPRHRLDPAALPADGPLPPARWAEVLSAVRRAPELRRALAADQQRVVDALLSAAPPGSPAWRVPDMGRDVHDFVALSSLFPHLPAHPLGAQPAATS